MLPVFTLAEQAKARMQVRLGEIDRLRRAIEDGEDRAAAIRFDRQVHEKRITEGLNSRDAVNAVNNAAA